MKTLKLKANETCLAFVFRKLVSVVPFFVISQSALFSCSDSAPPASQGAVSFMFGVATGSVRGCRLRTFTKNLGSVDATTKTPLVDGDGGASVKCRISPSGNGFQVNASLTTGINQFSLSGQVTATGTSSVLANVTTDDTLTSYSSGFPDAVSSTSDAQKPCELSFSAATTGTTGSAAKESLGISAGRLWAKFACADLRDAQDTVGAICAITQGYLFFDNCDN